MTETASPTPPASPPAWRICKHPLPFPSSLRSHCTETFPLLLGLMLNIPDLVNGAARVSWQLFLITVYSKIKETERLNYAFFVTDAAKTGIYRCSNTAWKIRFFIKNLFSKCGQLRIWSHLELVIAWFWMQLMINLMSGN